MKPQRESHGTSSIGLILFGKLTTILFTAAFLPPAFAIPYHEIGGRLHIASSPGGLNKGIALYRR